MVSKSEAYFAEYEDLGIHELMLKDRPRQHAYYNAIMQNKNVFENKVVMDVGAGTGILSAFCAKAGARLVYCVEASNLSNIASNIMEENKLSSTVKVINSRVEDVTLISPDEKVDIIVSEWMGFYLLHEGMLDSIIYARNKFLKSDGTMFPNTATIYVAPCSVPCRFDYWNKIDNISMKSFASELRRQKSNEPEILEIKDDNILHSGVVVAWFDLLQVTHDEVDTISIKEVIAAEKDGKHQGFCLWFECSFPSENEDKKVILSTAPGSAMTHWKQSVIILPDAACVDVSRYDPIAFQISLRRNTSNQRRYNIEVQILDPESEEHPTPCNCQFTKCILISAYLKTLSNSTNNST